MRITFLGHAGFWVETAGAVVVCDPWLSDTGAFDSSWFQLPRNHHLAAGVRDRLAATDKEKFVYVSHEHQDHLDMAFLESIRCRDLTVLIPDFGRSYLKELFAGYRCREVVACGDRERIEVPGGAVTLYLDDSELNRDSAVLVEGDGRTFLDLNDCRITDALPGIARDHGVVDVFTCQYSGAGWHPTCYDYPRDVYEAVAARKVAAKFRGVAQALAALRPRLYLPSAGPPCFLDPDLFHLNLEPANIFPRAPRLLAYLDRHLRGVPTRWTEVAPGDVVDAEWATVVHRDGCAVADEDFEPYVRDYAASYAPFFARRRCEAGAQDPAAVLARLQVELTRKLEPLTLHDRVTTPLWFRLRECDRVLRVDFPARRVDVVDAVDGADRYVVTASSADVARVLDGTITWDEFSLGFRMRLSREPDVYQTILQGFLRLEADDLDRFCARVLDVEHRQERILVDAGDRRFAVDRFCPHQGGDLRHAWVEGGRYLTCPRHQWRFDLDDGGRAVGNDGSVHAVGVDGE